MAKKRKTTFEELPFQKTCLKLLQSNRVKDARTFMKVCKFQEKRKCILELNYFAQKKQWDEFQETVNNYNKKKEPIVPWDEIADICLQEDEKKQAKSRLFNYLFK